MFKRLCCRSLVSLVSLLLLGNRARADDSLQAISPRLVTLHQTLPLADALREIRKQTGIDVTDKRQTPGNARIRIDLEKVIFWQALDALAREARVAFSLYQGNGQVALVDGPYLPPRVSYSGVFRTVVRRMSATRDMDSGNHYCIVDLEIAWEPRFRPFFVDQEGSSVLFPNARGEPTRLTQEGKGATEVQDRPALNFTIRFPAPERTVDRLTLLRGKLRVVTPSKMLLFSFDRLAAAVKAEQTQVQEGVKIRLSRFQAEDDPWEAAIKLDYPATGPHFDSYQSWLSHNRIFLEDKKTRALQRPLEGGLQVNKSAYPHADIVYYFSNKNGQLGKPERWSLFYRAPGPIVALPVSFEFKDLALP